MYINSIEMKQMLKDKLQ